MPGDEITAVDDISAADMSGSDCSYNAAISGTSLSFPCGEGNEVFQAPSAR